jgi:hypothetical protein
MATSELYVAAAEIASAAPVPAPPQRRRKTELSDG